MRPLFFDQFKKISRFDRLYSAFLGLLLALALHLPSADAQEFSVNDSEALVRVLSQLQAGDRLTLSAGQYTLGRFETQIAGTRQHPIIVRAAHPANTFIQAIDSETFVVRHSYWEFTGINLNGTATTDHAFHLSDNADHVAIRNCRLSNFDSHIKINGRDGRFPDATIIEGCRLYNDQPRHNRRPATAIDVVGGDNTFIRANTIYDFGAGIDGNTSYAIFLKGASSNGRIERNLIGCSVKHSGNRVGISLGGGGTAAQFCSDQRCEFEHRNGLVRNNIIYNCSDAGVHLRRARHSRIIANTLVFSAGIDIDPDSGPAQIHANYIGGGVTGAHNSQILWGQNLITGANQLPYHPQLHRWLESPLGFVTNWLMASPMGLGHRRLYQDFVAPDRLDLSLRRPHMLLMPAASKSQPLLNEPIDDFWGNRRSMIRWFGAIDYSQSSGNIGIPTAALNYPFTRLHK